MHLTKNGGTVTVSSIMIYPPLVTINWIVFVLFPFENCPVTVPERLNNGGAAGAAEIAGNTSAASPLARIMH